MAMARWHGRETSDTYRAATRQMTFCIAIASVAIVCGAYVCGAANVARADDVDIAMSPRAVDRPAALARLRERGPAGLHALLKRAELLDRKFLETPNDPRVTEAMAAINEAMNEVGATRYCRQSGLYWYTDIEQAKAEAKASGRPILALRMLGKLTDELSCANSRFFRTTLYANTEISKYLRENFVMIWTSVRPVPVITIDFGDGRKIERTITGNSIHFVLTSDGQVVDALPGLYGPGEFLAQVQRARNAALELSQLPLPQRDALRTRYHYAALARIAQRWQADLNALPAPVETAATGSATTPIDPIASIEPTATVAAAKADNLREAIANFANTAGIPVAPPKEPARTKKISVGDLVDGGGELPPLAVLAQEFTALERRMTDAAWEQVAERHAGDATLDDASLSLISAQRPNAAIAGRLAITKRVVENPLLKLVANLRQSTALDTVKNEYTFHRRLHFWLIENPRQVDDLNRLNERVYAELFLTPSSDPWLGLGQPDVYAAIPNNGVVDKAQ